MPSVLITGATGFVGHWLAKTAPSGFELDCMGRREYYHEIPQWFSDRYYRHYDYVIHAAPVQPTLVIKCARHNKARLLYVSSGIVYHGENNTNYRKDKITWERQCLEYWQDTVIARLFTFYGEKLSADHAIVAFMQAAREDKPLHVWGDGSCIRSYMSGKEMVRQMWAVLLRGKSGEAYDIGDDKPVTMLELANGIVEYYHSKSTIIVEGGKDAMPIYLPTDTAKTRALLDNHSSV